MKDEYKDLLDEHKRSGKMKSIAIIGESNPADIADYILDNNIKKENIISITGNVSKGYTLFCFVKGEKVKK